MSCNFLDQNDFKDSLNAWENAVRWLRDQPDQIDLVIDAYYDDPLLGAAERYWASQEWIAIRQYLPQEKTASVLDVGAGRGIASYAMARDGFLVTALEPDTSDLVGSGAIRSLAGQSGLPIEIREDFSEKLPFDDCSFDVIFARAVLHHTRDLGEACNEFFRVLKPGGRFIAVREHVISRSEDLDDFFTAHPLHRLYGGENAFLLAQYLEAISGADFIIRHILEPLESPINYAPHTEISLQTEVASIIGRKIRRGDSLIKKLLSLPCAWAIVRYILRKLDQRPGRLYSFVADRP